MKCKLCGKQFEGAWKFCKKCIRNNGGYGHCKRIEREMGARIR